MAAQEAFLDACVDGEADAAALLLEGDGVDGNAVVNPGYVHNDDPDDADTEDGDTVLTRAARHGFGGVARALVESGKADVNRAAPNRELPLNLAIECCRGRGMLYTPPPDAAADECVEVLLAADGINPNLVGGPQGVTALTTAAAVGSIAWVQRLLGVEGVAVNHASEANGDTALMEAAHNGHTTCLNALLHVGGADVNQAHMSGATALCLAAGEGNLGCIRALLTARGIDVNTRAAHYNSSPLIDAVTCRHGDWEGCARALALAKDADVSRRSPPGHTASGRNALHLVCASKHAALAAHLLAAGGCRFTLDLHGDTAVALAAGDAAVLKVFASGVDYWQRKRHGGHAWAMKEVAWTLLLVRQRLCAQALAAPGPAAAPGALSHLPEEIWLAACGFLRSADFVP